MKSLRGNVPDQAATRLLLRSSVLDALRELLIDNDWSKITMSAVASGAGVSRQTIYNEFKSRQGLAEAYALRLSDELVESVGQALTANEGDGRAALMDGFAGFLTASVSDPLVQSLLSGEAKSDLLRLVTIDSAPIVDRASERLAALFESGWINADPVDAGILSRGVVRLAMSYISIPPQSITNVTDDVGALLGPFVDAAVKGARDYR